MCLDFEFTNVNYAAQDLGLMLACCGVGVDAYTQLRRPFLEAYLEEMGRGIEEVGADGAPPSSAEEVDALMVDCLLYQLMSWHSGGRLSAWQFMGSPAEKVKARVAHYAEMARLVRSSPDAQHQLRQRGLSVLVAAFEAATLPRDMKRVSEEVLPLS